MPTQIQGIEFEVIGSGASEAAQSLDALTASLKKLKGVAGTKIGISSIAKEVKEAVKGGSASLKKFAEGLDAIATASEKLANTNGSIKEFAGSLSSISSFKSSSKAFDNLSEGIAKVGASANSLTTEAISKFERMAEALAKLDGVDLKGIGSAMRSISTSGKADPLPLPQELQDAISNASKIDILRLKLENLRDSLQDAFNKGDIPGATRIREQMLTVEDAIQRLEEKANDPSPALVALKARLSDMGKTALKAGMNLVSIPFRRMADNIKGLNGRLATLSSSLKRIAFYRIIRTIIKEIGQAFKDGMNNLYGWSALVGGQFKTSMDMIATSMLYFKNSIGAAVAPIVNALAPAIDFIVDKIVALINLINQLFALLSGATFWTRAKKKAVEYGDAVGGAGAAAKEALRYLAPFDELNRLPSENGGGGGGGGGADYSDMFEEMQTFDERIEEFAKSLKDAFNRADWKELGTLLGNKVNELVNAVPWSTAGKKVGSFINAWFTTKYWTLNTVNFNNIGSKISTFLNNMLGEIDFETMGRTITQPFTNLGDLIIGAVQTIDWKLVGSSISDFVRGAFKQLGDFLDKYDWTEVGSKMFKGLNDFIAGLDPMEVLSSLVTFAGKVASAMYQIIQGFFLGDKTFIDDSGVEWKFDVNGRLVKIEDKVPANQKVINNTTANLTTAKDSLTSRPSIKSTSSLTAYKNALSSNPTLNATASFNKVDTTALDSLNPPSIWATADIYDATVADGITVDASAEFTKIYGVPDYITTYGQIIYDDEGYYRPTEVSYTQMERNKSTIESQWGAYEYANGGVLTKGGFWKSIPQFASGGAIHGSLFLAGEDGTELVGRVGGRTEVLNRSQLAATMYASVNNAMRGMNQGADVSEDALYRAFRRALDETDFGGDVELDGEVMYRSMVRRNNQNTRMTGVNAFA